MVEIARHTTDGRTEVRLSEAHCATYGGSEAAKRIRSGVADCVAPRDEIRKYVYAIRSKTRFSVVVEIRLITYYRSPGGRPITITPGLAV